MTQQEEIVAIGKNRHGDNWKTGLATDTGWSWWTFNRIEKGEKVTDKVYRAVTSLKPKKERKAP